MGKPSLIINPTSEEVSKKLLELKEHLDKLNSTLKESTSSDVKKCTKRCIEVIDIAGELDSLFLKK